MAQPLANKYRPKTFDDVTEQGIVVDVIRKMCSVDPLTCRNFLLIGPAGTGKAQPMDSKVLTPSGFIDMRNVVVGQEVITARGNIGKVTEIYPQGKRPIYRITLQDRTSIKVSDNHLNIVYRYNQDKKCREDFCLPTSQLIELFSKSRFKLRVDTPKVDFPYQPVPIDPYLLGALIGDGSLTADNFGFSNSEDDVVDKVSRILERDWDSHLTKVKGDNYDWSITGCDASIYTFEWNNKNYTRSELIARLEELGYPRFDPDTIVRIAEGTAYTSLANYPELSNISIVSKPEKRESLRKVISELGLDCKSIDKHIPEVYLINSKEVRTALLQGLFDTDGSIYGGAVELSTSSPQLSKDIEFLVRSLGIRDTVVSSTSHYRVSAESEPIKAHDSFRHYLKIENGFPFYTSSKHAQRYKNRQNGPIRNIVSIEYIGDEECQCIYIDHPDHTYISDDFIPTHNTTSGRIIANMINDGECEPIEIDAASHSGVDAMREICDQARTYPVGAKYKVFILDEAHSITNAGFQVLLKTLEEQPARSVIIMCTTNPEKIPATILSRVQTFQLSKISVAGIHDRLVHILECENSEGRNITYQDSAIQYIAKLANGGMRDAITSLDKVLAYTSNITDESIEEALNLPNYDDYFLLLKAIGKKDNQSIITIIDRVYNSGVNFVKWFEGFASFVVNIVKYIYLKDITKTMIPAHYQDKIEGYGSAHASLCLKLSSKLTVLNQELKTTQYLQELAVSYLCTAPSKEEK